MKLFPYREGVSSVTVCSDHLEIESRTRRFRKSRVVNSVNESRLVSDLHSKLDKR